MKKLIIICLLALTYTSTYAQEPTKQETMDWIGSKFRENMSKLPNNSRMESMNFSSTSTNTFNFYSSGIVSWTEIQERNDDGEKRTITTTYKIDLNKLSNIRASTHNLTLYFKDGESINDVRIYTALSGVIYENYSIIDFQSEPDLYNRFVKALNVLVSYNSPKQKF